MRSHSNLKRAYIKSMTLVFLVGFQFLIGSASSLANDYVSPWKQKHRAIVLDAYEKNEIDWLTLSKNKRVRAFINKASDGLPSPWKCRSKGLELKLCKKTFQNFFMKKQIYHTRRLLAKALGMKWGAYHLGRPGNPIDQANNFIDFADPQEDELIALDIEDNDPEKWISFKDAEIFAKHIYHRLGRYPVLYTNHSTAKTIALRSDEFPILSRMQLWYARFKDRIPGVFPMGNWDNYAMWQFSAGSNCNKRRCLMRIAGTPNNIDVNITTMSIEEFDKAWPFNGLVPAKDIMMAFDDLLYVEDPRMIYDREMFLAQAPSQGNRGYFTPKKDNSVQQEMLMVNYPHPKDAIYELDEMVVASIAKAKVTHPVHQTYPVLQSVKTAEVIHPIHQVRKTAKTKRIAKVMAPIHQEHYFSKVVENIEMIYPTHQSCPVLPAVETAKVIHPIHQVRKISKPKSIAKVTHPLHQGHYISKVVEKAEVTHPVHQTYPAMRTVKTAKVIHPIHQVRKISKPKSIAKVTHPLHQGHFISKVVVNAEVTHPVHQTYPALRAVKTTEVIHPIHQVRKISKPKSIAKVTHPLHQGHYISKVVEKAEVTHPVHQEHFALLGVDETLVTGSTKRKRPIRHPLYRLNL